MALDRKNIDFLAVNTLPTLASWEIIEGGASVLVDTATLPPKSYIGHSLDPNFNDALSSAEYRRLTITLTSRPNIDSNYTTFQQLLVKLNIIYAANTNSEINETPIDLVMNDDDIIENSDGTFTLQRIIKTNSRAIQSLTIIILNTALNTVEVRDVRLQRSADINVGQIQSQLKLMQDSMTPKSFKVYEPNLDNVLDGIGVVIKSGIELKYKPIRVGNRLSSIETNFQEPMPVVYVAEHIDLTTKDDGSSEDTNNG